MRFYKYFLLSLLLMLVAQAKAQQFIGVRGSGGVSTVNFQNNINNANFFTAFTPAYSGGAFYRIYTGPHAGLQTGLDFTKKGFIQRLPASSTQDTLQAASYTYLEVPLMSSFYFFKGSTKVVLNLGPYFAYQLSNTQQLVSRSSGDIISEGPLDYDDFRDNRFDLGIRAELGLLQSFGPNSLELTGVFSMGLKNIINPDYPSAPLGTLNMYLGIQLAYMFQFDNARERFPFVDQRRKLARKKQKKEKRHY
ncbi:porin family protein [Persicobacter psychrovividus]|uniref:Outer membrane protein beta-barrel domain-containing protein n=1 Tax=Persicobacter psychrovividus TaxID=387638 RepID=A0ABM7VAW7_9BACT|nr:hypothetical protein PEPS_01150 [Persicobacter psychrovividus]